MKDSVQVTLTLKTDDIREAVKDFLQHHLTSNSGQTVLDRICENQEIVSEVYAARNGATVETKIAKRAKVKAEPKPATGAAPQKKTAKKTAGKPGKRSSLRDPEELLKLLAKKMKGKNLFKKKDVMDAEIMTSAEWSTITEQLKMRKEFNWNRTEKNGARFQVK